MSCNGCRVLRKGCSEGCALRECIQWIDGAEEQGNATIFVAKFFGRTGLMSFITAAPQPHRHDLFRSLLYEACGRTVNPVSGAVGLLSSGNWDLCQAAVEAVLHGRTPSPISDLDLSNVDGWIGRRPGEVGDENQGTGTPSMNSERSVETSSEIGDGGDRVPPRLLNLFV
ncbi:hypothetical protein J5N97_010363 [Dioscorea zingiberensis]|uniref:LOB domain-containing protein n=1 Tax=Dioscorea zingiberensis TaxID=325984 RepID=A0A9D5CZ93_9LILI|nr:hypothetical protein J5N97_010363 [Dioscorea zingiberensis]